MKTKHRLIESVEQDIEQIQHQIIDESATLDEILHCIQSIKKTIQDRKEALNH